MLLTRVELGQSKFLHVPDGSMTGWVPEDHDSILRTATGTFIRSDTAYDSVAALPEEQGGAVSSPDYVVYDASQATVEYIFEVAEGFDDD